MEQFANFFINHWELFLALGIILGLLLGDSLFRGARGYMGVSPVQATSLINHEEAILLDVREDNEFIEGHILNSLHIPAGRLTTRIKEIEKYRNRSIIVVCRSGNRSARISSFLHKQGFSQVYNLDGGLLAWKNANLPITKKR